MMCDASRRLLYRHLRSAWIASPLLLACHLRSIAAAPNQAPDDGVSAPTAVSHEPAGAAAALPPTDGGAAAVLRRRLLLQLTRTHPELAPQSLVSFYAEHSPEMLIRLDELLLRGRADAEAYLQRLAEHYLHLETVRAERPDEYERLIAIERLENETLRLGRRIVEIDGQLGAAQVAGRDRLDAERQAAKTRLMELLNRSFESAQQNQKIELNRLDAEVRELRRLLEEREAKRAGIIRRRYLDLTGEPEAK